MLSITRNNLRDKHIGCLYMIKSFADNLVSDFKKLPSIEYHNVYLFKIEEVYMHAIVINMAKIFSPSKNECFRLERLKSYCSDDVNDKIDSIINSHKQTISKIINNRDKLFSHLDKNYFNLCFSENEIQRMENNLRNDMKISEEETRRVFKQLPRPNNKCEERYTTNDLRDDLPEISEMLNEVDMLIKTVLQKYISEDNR